MKYRLLLFLPAALFLLSTACQRSAEPPAVSFYYWKSNFRLSDAEQAALRDNGVQRIYAKFLDVDVEGGIAVPKAPIRFEGDSHLAYELVPCVFITNRTFASGVAPEALAEKVWKMLDQINTAHQLRPVEYQFDCDWSGATRQAYFAFLRAMRAHIGEAALSVTVRLHQLRYPEATGLPPADRGVLMYYNMGDLQSLAETNSILNNETAETYLVDGMTYALPLDYALPIFSWVLAYRFGELYAIMGQVDCNELESWGGAEKTADGQYRVQQNAYFGNHYLNTGDRLRCEGPSEADLQRAVRQLNKIQNHSETLLFYHLDERFLHHFPAELPLRLAGRLAGD